MTEVKTNEVEAGVGSVCMLSSTSRVNMPEQKPPYLHTAVYH